LDKHFFYSWAHYINLSELCAAAKGALLLFHLVNNTRNQDGYFENKHTHGHASSADSRALTLQEALLRGQSWRKET